MPTDLRELIEPLAALRGPLHDKDFLLSWDLSDAQLRSVLLTAEILGELYAQGTSTRVFDTGIGLSIFRDNSTRTRYAFRAGCNLLGLMTEELDESTSQIAHGETVRETATMISFCTEVIGIRDDMFLGRGHAYQAEVAQALSESVEEGVLAQRPSVINLQCDLDHPTQSMSDLAHLSQHFGGLENLAGKKIAMTWAYSPSYGKPLSVPQAVVALMARFGAEVVLAHPEGYELVDEPLDAARKHASAGAGSLSVVDSMEEAFDGADVVYPKSWAPLGVMKERTKLVEAGRHDDLAALEQEALAQNAQHKQWECTESLMKRTCTRGGEALYMHCLPADITGVSCKEGEVAASVFERYRLQTYREASYKPFVVAAMVLNTRFSDPAAVLQTLAGEARPRRRS